VKHPQGVEIDDYGFTIVDWRNVGHKDEPWVLAATVEQVFYILDLKDEKKYIVVLGNNEFSESKMWRMRKNTTNVMRCLSLWIQEGKNFVETNISYSNVIPYARTDGEEKLVHV
jgi:hypothetical protein